MRPVAPATIEQLTPDMLLRAYTLGIFPMAEAADSEILYWLDPKERGVLPLDGRFKVPDSLWRLVRQRRFRVTVDRAFTAVMEGCAESTATRAETWINGEIRRLYGQLHLEGFAHSVEVWDAAAPESEDARPLGGLYGVTLGGVFFGESMFSRARDASKVALVHLTGRLLAAGFRLHDTQFLTDHLARFGGVAVQRGPYRQMLARALEARPAALPSIAEEDALASVAALIKRAPPPVGGL